MPRVTSAYLKKWLQLEFCRLGIEVIVKEAYKTKYRPQDYESGAAVYVLRVGTNDTNNDCSVYCFIPCKELQEALNNGKVLKWIPNNGAYIQDSYINYQ